MKKMIWAMIVISGLVFNGDLMAQCVTLDSGAPDTMATLKVVSSSDTTIVLSGTVPGDKGPNKSSLAEIDIRYSTIPITALNWATRSQLTGEPLPAEGNIFTFSSSVFAANTLYYFAEKTKDACGKWSLISNMPSATTLSAQAKVSLVWDPSVDHSYISGYKVYVGYDSGQYVMTQDAGKVLSTDLLLPRGAKYYFAAVAYDTRGQSGYSNEVSTTP